MGTKMTEGVTTMETQLLQTFKFCADPRGHVRDNLRMTRAAPADTHIIRIQFHVDQRMPEEALKIAMAYES